MSNLPIHFRLDKVVFTAVGQSHGRHTIGDGFVPIEVLPIPTD